MYMINARQQSVFDSRSEANSIDACASLLLILDRDMDCHCCLMLYMVGDSQHESANGLPVTVERGNPRCVVPLEVIRVLSFRGGRKPFAFGRMGAGRWHVRWWCVCYVSLSLVSSIHNLWLVVRGSHRRCLIELYRRLTII